MALGACICVPAFADESTAPASAAQEVVVVTAQKQKTNLQKTALAVSVVSGDALDKGNVSSLYGISGSVPSLTITKTGGRETVPTIRGIGSATPENTGSTGPGVSIYIDGVYVGDSVSASEGLFDLSRVEVLRGPQGSLYGVSSIGGALILVSNQPRIGVSTGSAEFSAGNYEYTRARVAYNIPINDTLAFRFSGQKLDHKGYTTNTLNPSHDLDDEHTSDIKGALLWQPNDSFSATLTSQYYVQRNNGAAQKWVNDPNPDPRVVTQDFNAKNDLQSNFTHLNLDWQFEKFDFNSITAYRDYDSKLASNMAFSSISIYPQYDFAPTWHHSEKAYTQEFNITSKPDSNIKWIAGIFLLSRKGDDKVLEYRGTNINDPMPENVDVNLPASSLPTNLVYGNITQSQRTVVEPFVQASIPVTEKLNLTVGARYNFERKKNTSDGFSTYSNPLPFTQTDDTKIPTWRLVADYALTQNNMLYASWSTGYKAGGINGNSSPYVVPVVFKAEKNKAIEIGSKNTFFDKTLRVNLAAFHYNYTNMQYIETDPIPFNQGMANIPKIEINGLETEINYNSPDHKLRANGSITIERGKIKGNTLVLYPSVVNSTYASSGACAWGGQYWNPGCWAAVAASAVNIEGNSPPAMPKFMASVDVSYDFTLSKGILTPRLSANYRSSQWARIFNESGIDNIKGYGLINADITYQPDNSNYTFSLTVSNLLDKDAVNSRYTSPYESGLTSLEYVAPRQYVAAISYKF